MTIIASEINGEASEPMNLENRRHVAREMAQAMAKAIRLGDFPKIKQLLDREVELKKAEGSEAVPAIIQAVMAKNIDAVKMLLKHGVDSNVRDMAGSSALHEAAKVNDTQTMALLINAGAQVMAKDTYGQTPLHAAAFYDCASAITMLIEHGADPGCKNNRGETPKVLAADMENEEALAALASMQAGLAIAGLWDGSDPPARPRKAFL